ncbi:MAG TPA: DegV family protein [Acidimicrobiia bacterium]|jgi:DegV family protein with EDD domain
MAVRIVTDSSCDLPQPLCDELGIDVVPLTVRFGDEELLDRKEITTEQFWPRLSSSSVLPETAAPPVGAFYETFKSLADTGADGIVCINISSKLSATLQSAQIAADRLDGTCPIAVVDSESASMGIGVHVLHAARRAREGADVDTIVREIAERRSRTHVYFTIDTLEFLRRGGRIGGAQALLGSVLSIKPVLTMEHGAIEPATKVRTRSKALRYLVDKAKESPVEELAVLHAAAGDIDEFCVMLEPLASRDELIVSTIGPVVGVHAGPGTVGVVWLDAR